MADCTPLDRILRTGFDDFREFVNPFIANRAQLAREPVRFRRTEAGALLDEEGRVVEDLHGTQVFGHRHPAIARAVREFLESDVPSWFPSRVNPFAGALARRLCERTGYSNVYFGCSGSDAVEASLKLARALTRRPRVLSLTGGYHGCTFGSCALMNAGPFRDPFGPHLPGVEAIGFGDSDALSRALAAGDVGAVVVEPIQGEGGVRPLPPPFVEALCELTARHGALLVADEIQTGLGRSGHFLRSEGWPRRPDVVLLGKGLAGGLFACSAMLTHRAIFERAYGSTFEAAESHNSTFSYNAVTSVAALAALDLLSDELFDGIRERGAALRAGLSAAMSGNPLFAEVRGDGFMAGVALVQPDHPWVSFEQFGFPTLRERATIGALLCSRLYRRGFFCFVCGHDWSVLRLQPRFTIPGERLEALAAACGEELSHLAELV